MFEKVLDKAADFYNSYGAAAFAGGALILIAVEGVTAYNAGKKVGQNPEMSRKDKMWTIAPAVISGVGAAACIVGSQAKNAGTIAAMSTPYISSEEKRKEIKEKAEKYIGKENVEKIKRGFKPYPDEKKETEILNPMAELKEGEFFVVDDISGNSATMTLEEIYKRLEEVHKRYLVQGGYLSWNDYFETMGFEKIVDPKKMPVSEDDFGDSVKNLTGEDIGWSSMILSESGYEYDWIDFNVVKRINPVTNKESYLIECLTPASVHYLDL